MVVRSPGKLHENTKVCAKNSAILLFQEVGDKNKTRKFVKEFPHLLQEEGGFGDDVKKFIR